MERKKFSEPQLAESKVDELSRKLFEANERLRKSEAIRVKMLENISHDLRAPLTAIRSGIDLLSELIRKDKADSDELQRIVGLLESRASSMEALVQDLYYLTCLDNGKQQMEFKDVPLEQFLEEYFFEAEIDEKFLDKELVLKVSDEHETIVSIDVCRMTRVLDNLFTNAAKYSESGAEIELGIEKKDEGSVRFYVRDTGIGIPEERIENIFERTYKVSDARTPKGVTGSGLGLSIVKSIMEHHGGKVYCESRVGEGSKFVCVLPVKEKND